MIYTGQQTSKLFHLSTRSGSLFGDVFNWYYMYLESAKPSHVNRVYIYRLLPPVCLSQANHHLSPIHCPLSNLKEQPNPISIMQLITAIFTTLCLALPAAADVRYCYPIPGTESTPIPQSILDLDYQVKVDWGNKLCTQSTFPSEALQISQTALEDGILAEDGKVYGVELVRNLHINPLPIPILILWATGPSLHYVWSYLSCTSQSIFWEF